ncbi:MAG: type II secretion system GspH family protein [Candidatus Sumerlaeaceae bacterium]|nr:type II secretion system GspH family protein [Candidatus Sumerlaeaceae bacterium]
MVKKCWHFSFFKKLGNSAPQPTHPESASMRIINVSSEKCRQVDVGKGIVIFVASKHERANRRKMLMMITNRAGKRGFTLAEMLIVAALIALFSGLFIFSIETQYTLNKQKASVAECRQIATAMSFAQQDIGFFPKICFLRFNSTNLISLLSGMSFDAVEYHSLSVGDLQSRLLKQWKGPYAAFAQDRTVKMQFISNGITREFDWPADPFGNPYVAYFVTTDPPSGGNPIRHRFVWNAGERPNEFAGIVSYGRNRVPGLGDMPPETAVNQRKGYRLYLETANPRVFQLLQAGADPTGGTNPYNTPNGRLNMILLDPLAGAVDTLGPRIRETGSDDRYVEF